MRGMDRVRRGLGLGGDVKGIEGELSRMVFGGRDWGMGMCFVGEGRWSLSI